MPHLYYSEDEKPEKKNCLHCGKPLVAIGNARKNGKNHKDWHNRDYHKKCWKERIFLSFWIN